MAELEDKREPTSEDIILATHIATLRIYDLLAVIALKLDPALAEQILDIHEAGHVKSDFPWMAEDE